MFKIANVNSRNKHFGWVAYFYCIASTSGRTVFKRFQLLNCNILRHACPIVSET